jgi:hypothetical protein
MLTLNMGGFGTPSASIPCKLISGGPVRLEKADSSEAPPLVDRSWLKKAIKSTSDAARAVAMSSTPTAIPRSVDAISSRSTAATALTTPGLPLLDACDDGGWTVGDCCLVLPLPEAERGGASRLAPAADGFGRIGRGWCGLVCNASALADVFEPSELERWTEAPLVTLDTDVRRPVGPLEASLAR